MHDPTIRMIDVDGLKLAIHEWPHVATAEGSPTLAAGPVVLIHATGLCARVWEPVVALLPDTLRVLAVDLRGHGRSDCPAPIAERVQWRQFGEDVAAMLEALDLTDVTLVGHSMGGHTATVAALEAPERVARLVLLDPTLTPRPKPGDTPRPPASEQPSRRRRNEWPSPAAFYENLRGKPNFAAWSEDALRAYTTHGLRPVDGDGEDTAESGYVLACPPLFEASVYAGNQDACLDDDLPRITAAVSVLRARPRTPDDAAGLGPSATRVEALALFQSLADRQHPTAGHFFPQEEPALAAEAILDAIARPSG